MEVENRLIEVSNNNENWYRRVLIFEKNDRFFCWDSAETLEDAEKTVLISTWKYMREISEPKYVPFTWEDRDLIKGKWVRPKSGVDDGHLITLFSRAKENRLYVVINTSFIRADNFLEDYEFLDGTPCGKLAEQL